jgi:hypothetical protein
LIVKAFYRTGCIFNLFEENIGESFRVVRHRVFNDFDIYDVTVLSEDPSQILIINASWNSGNIDIIAYDTSLESNLPGFST